MYFEANRSGFGARRLNRKVICEDCKQACEVPYKPTSEMPALCSECFSKNRLQARQINVGQATNSN